MNLLAYIICHHCGHQIGGSRMDWQFFIPLAVAIITMTASKLITGKWIP